MQRCRQARSYMHNMHMRFKRHTHTHLYTHICMYIYIIIYTYTQTAVYITLKLYWRENTTFFFVTLCELQLNPSTVITGFLPIKGRNCLQTPEISMISSCSMGRTRDQDGVPLTQITLLTFNGKLHEHIMFLCFPTLTLPQTST